MARGEGRARVVERTRLRRARDPGPGWDGCGGWRAWALIDCQVAIEVDDPGGGGGVNGLLADDVGVGLREVGAGRASRGAKAAVWLAVLGWGPASYDRCCLIGRVLGSNAGPVAGAHGTPSRVGPVPQDCAVRPG